MSTPTERAREVAERIVFGMFPAAFTSQEERTSAIAALLSYRKEVLEEAVSELKERRALLHQQFETIDIGTDDSIYRICIEAIRELGGPT